MAKQWTELERLVVKKGDTESNPISLHPKTGTIATVTIYAPLLTAPAALRVSADGRQFVKFFHKGQIVKLQDDAATDIPLPACKAMRVELMTPEDEDVEFRLLALLEVD